MVERGDRRDHAEQGVALGEDLALLAMRRQVAGKHLAVVVDHQLAGEVVDVEGAAAFVERILFRQAAFGGDQVGNLFLALDDGFGDARQNLLPLVARQRRFVSGGEFESLGDLCAAGARHGADDFTVVGVQYVDVLAGIAIDQLAGDAHFFMSD